MSKIGKQPVKLAEGISAQVEGRKIEVSGPKGAISYSIPKDVEAKITDGEVRIELKGKTKKARSVFGTTRANIANMVKGVKEGWKKELELVGTGFRAEVTGADLILTIGYSHPVKIPAPDGITFAVEKTKITISGVDKELVGLVAAKVRAVRPPEPYQGKGIRYLGEVIRRKVGKAAKAAGAPA